MRHAWSNRVRPTSVDQWCSSSATRSLASSSSAATLSSSCRNRYSSRSRSWPIARNWSRVEPALARQRTLVLVNGPSHGGSQPASRRFTLADCAAAAGEVLDQLGVTAPVDWVGSAWGGHVGMVFAAEWPQRARSLVALASPVHAPSPAGRRRIVPLVELYRVLGAPRSVRDGVVDALLTPECARTGPRPRSW